MALALLFLDGGRLFVGVLRFFCFEDESTLEEALFLWDDSSADFADCMIGAKHRRQGCRATASFDVKAIKLPMFVAV